MRKVMSLYDFRNDMMEVRPDNFSYLGLEALYNYFIAYEQDTDFELDFDPIAFCCEYTEDSIANILDNYGLESLEELQHNTTVLFLSDDGCEDDDHIIIQNY